MLFNRDPSKRLKKCYFQEKRIFKFIQPHCLDNVQTKRVSYQKHLGILLDKKLNFNQHIDSAVSKVKKGISVIKKLRHNSPRKLLVTI